MLPSPSPCLPQEWTLPFGKEDTDDPGGANDSPLADFFAESDAAEDAAAAAAIAAHRATLPIAQYKSQFLNVVEQHQARKKRVYDLV